MDRTILQPDVTNALTFLFGGGEMGRRTREYNWSVTPLGVPEGWPQSLRSTVSICLNSNFPIAIYWGDELTLLYNDAWSPIPGNKHPWALGKTAREVWPEIWDVIGPQFQKAFNGEAGGSQNALLPMNRHGYVEECYFNFTFTPIYGEGGKVEGVFNAVIETTKTVLNERQSHILHELGNLDRTSATVDEIINAAAHILEKANKDFPFGAIYKIDEEEQLARRFTTFGMSDNEQHLPLSIRLTEEDADSDDLYQCCKSAQIVISEKSANRKGLPRGGWDIEPTRFIHLPIAHQNSKTPIAILTAGLNPYRQFDESYRQFAQLIADQISTEVNNALAYEMERKRTAALAEIDKAKTAFFTNISHEFRTPLTLMLGSLEQLAGKAGDGLTAEARQIVDTSQRNAMRLLRLVNNLLDFSRLEAGRVKAQFQHMDVAAYSADLASSFRSVIEAAGLDFHVACDEVKESVYLDKEMWEKIVLNLLSNAFKYTLAGGISLSLRDFGDHFRLEVSDTGVGIPEAELPKMFQRFHRVQNVTGRTYEGTGIGLSLVKELVHLHGGSITVSSSEGVGTTFTVTIPTGKKHLTGGLIEGEDAGMTSATVVEAFLEEAASLAERQPLEPNAVDKEKAHATVLVVEDNSDLRGYISGLLQAEFNVITAGNGAEALLKLFEHKVDLVLSDIMMPVMDGIQLLKAIKGSPQTATLPVVLLSARAGEEARVEGLDIGADDYLIKPFSAKELIARVTSQVALSRKRNNVLQDVYKLFDAVAFGVVSLKGKELIIEYVNQYTLDIWQQKSEEVIGRPMFEVMPETRDGAQAVHDEVYRTGRRFSINEIPVSVKNNGIIQTRYFNAVVDPSFDEEGNVTGQLATTIEVTEQVLARRRIEESEQRFRILAETLPQMIWSTDGRGHNEYHSGRWLEYSGMADPHDAWAYMIHPDDRERSKVAYDRAYNEGIPFRHELRLRNKGGEYRWHVSTAEPVKDSKGNVSKWVGSITDIHHQKATAEKLERLVAERTSELARINEELQRSNEDLQQFAHVASHDLKEPVRKVITFAKMLESADGDKLSERGRISLDKVHSAADRMMNMVNGVLSYSKLSATEQKLQTIDIGKVVASAEADLEMLIAQKAATIVKEDLPCVPGTPLLIHQLFYNLLNNALKFSRDEIAPVITISGESAGHGKVRITVADNGIGFEQQYADNIFKTFTRLNAKDKYEGTGLGLSLCKKIVERHGGTIKAEGAEGIGAKFIITLPSETTS